MVSEHTEERRDVEAACRPLQTRGTCEHPQRLLVAAGCGPRHRAEVCQRVLQHRHARVSGTLGVGTNALTFQVAPLSRSKPSPSPPPGLAEPSKLDHSLTL